MYHHETHPFISSQEVIFQGYSPHPDPLPKGERELNSPAFIKEGTLKSS